MYRMQVFNEEDCRRRPPDTQAKKHFSLWWSLPRLNRDLIQCKPCLEFTEYSEGIGCLSPQRALTRLLLWLRSLVMTFIAVTGASFKDRELPLCRFTQMSTWYIAWNVPCPRRTFPRGVGFKVYCANSLCVHTERIKGCLSTARSKLTLTTSQPPQKIMRLLEFWEISQVFRWCSQMMPSGCNFWMGRKDTSRSNGHAVALHKGSPWFTFFCTFVQKKYQLLYNIFVVHLFIAVGVSAESFFLLWKTI